MAAPPIQSARRVVKLRLGPHDRIVLGGRPYCRPRPTRTGYEFRRDDAPELSEALTDEQIDGLTRAPGYRYERDFYAPTAVRHRAAKGARSMDDLSRAELPEVLFRWEVCRRVDRLSREGRVTRSKAGIEAALAIVRDEVAPLECAKVRPQGRGTGRKDAAGTRSPERRGGRRLGVPTSGKPDVALRRMPPVPTFWKWWRKYRASGGKPWGLRDEYGNCGGSPAPIGPEAAEILEGIGRTYGDVNRPSQAMLLERLRNEVAGLNAARPEADRIACPSRKQLLDFLRSLRHVRVVAGREGIETARRKTVVVSQGVGAVRPLERVEIDHWEVHLQGILVAVGLWARLTRAMRRRIGRMQLCVAIDCATKVILGMHLSETAKTADALAVLRMIVSDKGAFADAAGATLPWDMCGTPETIATDAGSAFVSEEFGLAAASLLCDHLIPPAGLPFLRGTIERFFRTVHMRLIARFRGRTFEDMVARGDYPSEKLANLDTRDLAWVIVRWVVDVYHATPHEGLGGMTPRQAWRQGVELFGTTPPPDPHVRRSIFGIRVIRTLNNEGIRVLGLRYWSKALVELFLDRGKVEVELKLDPADVGEISVRIGDRWEAAGCVRGDVAGVDAATWIQAAIEMRRVNANCAALDAAVVRQAIADVEGVGQAALDRESIANPTPTEAQIDALEREQLLGFWIPDPVAADAGGKPADPLAGGFTVADAPAAPPPPPSPDPGARVDEDARRRMPPASSEPADEAPETDDDFDLED